ncbi:LytR C-terminal domain-containing protein [bacterium]|nr:LytR C-terminal domain-containing protein [bacterium]
MLKNNKLLYILPEMSFTATVGETPKQDYYFVQTFHQINGEFMRDENFIHESLKKLFERVEEAQYTLVLPDFLFTDTIVNVPETDDVKIAQYLRDQLLPRIEVSTFSHETRTSVLLQRKTTAKVQLSAFEKELAASLKLAIGSRDITIDEIVPLSWALKAAVSLEPSLTIAQVGERLYLAEHYIGINQTISTPINDLDVLAESVRTLKGSDPNLQTTYLFTSQLVEEKLKKFLLKTLPVQQLTEPIEEEAKIPPYVKQIIEVTARTLSLSDFAVPRFTLQADDLLGQIPALPVTQAEETTETKVEPETSVESIDNHDNQSTKEQAAEVAAVATAVARSLDLETASDAALASPTAKQSQSPADSTTSAAKSAVALDSEKETPQQASESEVSEPAQPAAAEQASEVPATTATPPQVATASLNREPTLTQAAVSAESVAVDAKSEASSSTSQAEVTAQASPVLVESAPAIAAKPETPALASASTPAQLKQPETPVLSQPAKVEQLPSNEAMPRLSFMSPKQTATSETISATNNPSSQDTEATKNDKTSAKNDKKDDKISASKQSTSKKKGSMSSFIKKLLLFLLIFVIVIAIGIGVGVLILSMTDKDFFKRDDLPEPEMSALPTPEPEEVPVPEESSPEAEIVEEEEEIDPAEFSLKVVNATGVAGLAGKAKTALESAGFSGVQTGNAAGEYETEGTFVLMKEKNSALIKALEQATGRTMNYDEDVDVEDKAGSFDAVIVLNEE